MNFNLLHIYQIILKNIIKKHFSIFDATNEVKVLDDY